MNKPRENSVRQHVGVGVSHVSHNSLFQLYSTDSIVSSTRKYNEVLIDIPIICVAMFILISGEDF